MVDVDGFIPGTRVRVEDATKAMLEHLRLYLDGDGSEAHMWDSAVVGGPGMVPTLLLTTRGAKSGAVRRCPLVYGKTDVGYILVGSGGTAAHPAWYYNLIAHPDVEIQVATERHLVRARAAEGEQRARLWKHMVGVYPNYETYQASTEREIPVVVLEPRR